MEETAAPATVEEIKEEVATMGLDSKPDSEINGQPEARLYVVGLHLHMFVSFERWHQRETACAGRCRSFQVSQEKG